MHNSVTPSVTQVSHRDTYGTDGARPLVAQRKSARLLIGLPVVRIHPRGQAHAKHMLSKRMASAMATCHRRVERRVSRTLHASCMNPSLICREGYRNVPEPSGVPRGIHPESMRNTSTDPHKHRAGRT